MLGMCAGTFFEISAGSMSMWMNFARGAAPDSLPIAVVEARADRDDQVGLVHRVVGAARTVHAEHAEDHCSLSAGNAPSPISVQVTEGVRRAELRELLGRAGIDHRRRRRSPGGASWRAPWQRA